LPKVTAYSQLVTPAKAGVQNMLKRLDSGFRRNDGTKMLAGFGEPVRTDGPSVHPWHQTSFGSCPSATDFQSRSWNPQAAHRIRQIPKLLPVPAVDARILCLLMNNSIYLTTYIIYMDIYLML